MTDQAHSKTIVITQSNYIPWKGHFDMLNKADEFVIFDEMQYTKRDWRNRNKIQTPNGPKWLSVPVEVKGKYFQKINETKVADPNWAQSHWNQIVQSYKKTPGFHLIKERLEDFYLNNPPTLLTEINESLLKILCDILDIQVTFLRSKDFDLAEDKTERLLNICLERNADHYITGPSAQNYMDEELFNKANVDITYMNFSYKIEYTQLHPEFTHAVSVIDPICMLGEDFKAFFKK